MTNKDALKKYNDKICCMKNTEGKGGTNMNGRENLTGTGRDFPPPAGAAAGGRMISGIFLCGKGMTQAYIITPCPLLWEGQM